MGRAPIPVKKILAKAMEYQQLISSEILTELKRKNNDRLAFEFISKKIIDEGQNIDAVLRVLIVSIATRNETAHELVNINRSLKDVKNVAMKTIFLHPYILLAMYHYGANVSACIEAKLDSLTKCLGNNLSEIKLLLLEHEHLQQVLNNLPTLPRINMLLCPDVIALQAIASSDPRRRLVTIGQQGYADAEQTYLVPILLQAHTYGTPDYNWVDQRTRALTAFTLQQRGIVPADPGYAALYQENYALHLVTSEHELCQNYTLPMLPVFLQAYRQAIIDAINNWPNQAVVQAINICVEYKLQRAWIEHAIQSTYSQTYSQAMILATIQQPHVAIMNLTPENIHQLLAPRIEVCHRKIYEQAYLDVHGSNAPNDWLNQLIQFTPARTLLALDHNYDSQQQRLSALYQQLRSLDDARAEKQEDTPAKAEDKPLPTESKKEEKSSETEQLVGTKRKMTESEQPEKELPVPKLSSTAGIINELMTPVQFKQQAHKQPEKISVTSEVKNDDEVVATSKNPKNEVESTLEPSKPEPKQPEKKDDSVNQAKQPSDDATGKNSKHM